MLRKLSILIIITLTGCASMPVSKATKVKLELCPGETTAKEGFIAMTVDGTDQTVYLSKESELSNADVKSAQVIDLDGHPQVEILFNEIGTKKFAIMSERCIHKPIGVLVDGKLIGAPVAMEKITSGKVRIIGQFTEKEAKRMADGILGR